MFKYGALYLAVLCLAGLLGWLPARLLKPIRISQLRLLYRISTSGPGGFDDAVHNHVTNNADRYSAPVLQMLTASPPRSSDQEVGLFFVELVRKGPEIDGVLNELAKQHPDPKVRDFVRKILRDRTADRRAS